MNPEEIRAFGQRANLPLKLRKRYPEYQRPGGGWTAELYGIGYFVYGSQAAFAEGDTADEATANLAKLLSHRTVVAWGERLQLPALHAESLPVDLTADPQITEGENVFRQILAAHRGIQIDPVR